MLGLIEAANRAFQEMEKPKRYFLLRFWTTKANGRSLLKTTVVLA